MVDGAGNYASAIQSGRKRHLVDPPPPTRLPPQPLADSTCIWSKILVETR